MIGLLDAITPPELMASLAERRRIVEQVAAQMGATITEAQQHLRRFENCNSSEGQTVN
jgi:hypothetical protein